MCIVKQQIIVQFVSVVIMYRHVASNTSAVAELKIYIFIMQVRFLYDVGLQLCIYRVGRHVAS